MKLCRILVVLRGSVNKIFYEKKLNYRRMYSINANGGAQLFFTKHIQIHVTTESILKIVIYRFSQP